MNVKSLFERLREKKRMQEPSYSSNGHHEPPTDTEDTTEHINTTSNMSAHSSTASANSTSSRDPPEQQPTDPPSGGKGGKAKSPFHALFFDATDDWIQAQTSSGSGSTQAERAKSPKPTPEEIPGVDQIFSSESSFETTFEDKDENDYKYVSPAPSPENARVKPTALEESKNPLEPEERVLLSPNQLAVESTTHLDPPQAMDDPPAEAPAKSSDSIVSMESFEENMDMTASVDSKISMTPGEAAGRGTLSAATSFDSQATIRSDVTPLTKDFQNQQKVQRQASWARFKSLSFGAASSSSSIGELPDVFIRDKLYAWVPAKVLEYRKDYALVAIDPPDDWEEPTVLEEEGNASSDDLHPSMKSIPKDDVSRSTSLYGLPPSQLRKVLYKDYEQGELPLQNKQGEGKRDMADLMELHAATILYNLKNRHYHQKPYTRVGDIVIAMNPFEWINELYSPETRDFYSKNLVWEAHQEMETEASDLREEKSIYDRLGFDPHVYEVSSLSYRGLAITGQDQTILVTGESGAGKTETVKIVMDHLATVQQTRPGGVPTDHSTAKEIVDRVCKSSPAFEAFGNAKTLRNKNSSRFGKFIQLQFELEPRAIAQMGERSVPFTDLVGSNCTTYLLEKNRVVFHAEGERTYHIFYQLLAAPREFKEQVWPTLADRRADDFSYTAGHGCENRKDAELWDETKDALGIFKFQGEMLKTLMQALVIVLQLGNLIFDHDPSDFEEHNTIITSKEELNQLSAMMGIESQDIEDTMTSRVLKTRGHDDIKVKLSPQVAKESCDALAKEIYSKIFDLMVRRINEYTACREPLGPREDILGHISLLDIFGFERFDVNQFEQLCINYANERLHQKYVLDNFNEVKDEYHAEGVDLYDFRLVDNSEILDLLQGNPAGLIAALNEECLRPKGNAESFVYKVKVAHEGSKRLINKKLHRKSEFGINHFTGAVEYDAQNFVERNMDKLPDGLLECAAKSTNALIRDEFQTSLSTRAVDSLGSPSSAKKKKVSSRTVLQKFQTQLKSLLVAMEGTKTRYIRCIKPNTEMIPRKTNHKGTMLQLECSGLMTALTISRESFPNKLHYEFILDRYSCLMLEKDFNHIGGMELKEKVEHILSKWLKPLSKKNRDGRRTMPFACGKSKVFFKAGAQDRLEQLRSEYYERSSVKIQTLARKVASLQRWSRVQKSVCILQSFCRMTIESTRLRRQCRAVTLLATWIRGRWCMALLVDMRIRQRSAVKIQTLARKGASLQRWSHVRKSVCTLQSFCRMVVESTRFSRRSRAVTLLAAWIRGRWCVTLLADIRRQMAATVVQSQFRSVFFRHQYLKKLVAVIIIQKSVRAFCDRRALQAQLHTLALQAKTETHVSALIDEVESSQRKVEDKTPSSVSEVEDVFGFLRSEIASLRGEKEVLWDQLNAKEAERRELTFNVQGSKASLSLFRSRVQDLTKANDQLVKEIFKSRHETSKLKRRYQSNTVQSVSKLVMAEEELKNVRSNRETEVKALTKTLKESQKGSDEETHALKHQVALLKEKHSSQTRKLREELRITQESHQEYLTKLMEVLESTHAMREEETSKISAELHAVKQEKDNQIRKLQQQVETLNRMKKDNLKNLRSGSRITKSQLQEESDTRARRSAQFDDVVQSLQSLVAESCALPLDVDEVDLQQVVAQQERGEDMADMVEILSHIYKMEEDSKDKANQAALSLVQEYDAASEPNRAVSELSDRLADMEFETERLREELKAKEHCRRCEIRESAARRRIHGAD